MIFDLGLDIEVYPIGYEKAHCKPSDEGKTIQRVCALAL